MTNSTGDVQTVLRVQVTLTSVILSYHSSLDHSIRRLNIMVGIPPRTWIHIALQVT